MIGYLIFAAVWVALDQGVKFLVRAAIPLHTSQPFLPGFDQHGVKLRQLLLALLVQFIHALNHIGAAPAQVIVISGSDLCQHGHHTKGQDHDDQNQGRGARTQCYFTLAHGLTSFGMNLVEGRVINVFSPSMPATS